MIQYSIHLIIFFSLLSITLQLLPDISLLINQAPLSFLEYKEEPNMTFDNDSIIKYTHYHYIQPIIGNATSNISDYQNKNNAPIIRKECLDNISKFIVRNSTLLINNDEKDISYYYLQKLIF